MNVLVLSPGQDTGGIGAFIARSFRDYAPDWRCTAVHATDTYIKYPADVRWDDRTVDALYESADVVHWKDSASFYGSVDRGRRRPTVVHHQGTRLRVNAEAVHREAQAIGAVELVSTIDLLLCAPGATWIGAPYERDEMMAYRNPHRGPRIRIGHSPTNRVIKGTDALIDACGELTRRGYDIELDLVEHVSWTACLSRKGRCDIYVDQLSLGYGNNAVEAFAMGVPVVCGVADANVRSLMLDTWGALPFAEATPKTLVAVLARLIEEEGYRREVVEAGARHFDRYHSAPVVVEQLKEVYRAVPESLGALFARPFGRTQRSGSLVGAGAR